MVICFSCRKQYEDAEEFIESCVFDKDEGRWVHECERERPRISNEIEVKNMIDQMFGKFDKYFKEFEREIDGEEED